MNRIDEKIDEIENFIDELSSILPENFEEYKTDFKLRAIGERYFEKIIENLKQPEEDKEAFDILAKEKIISELLAEKLKDAKGMRNILAHEYGRIDNELVFHSLAEEIIPDVQEFIEIIKKL